MTEFYYPSAGKGNIHAVIWEPEGAPKAVLQIVHGVAEHILRYERVAEALNAAGIVVAGEDHMGHGKSVTDGQKLGVFYGTWKDVAADSHSLTCQLQQRYPTLPLFLLGHSMGSFLVRTMLILYPEMNLHAAILSGTGWQPKPLLAVGKAICSLDCKINGAEHVSKQINQLAFGSYTKAFAPCRTIHDWVCSILEEVDRYENDPYCAFDVSSVLAREMMCGLQLIENPAMLRKMKPTLPVWFFSGKHDPVGDMTRGVEKTAEAFRKAGMQQVSVTFYEGRHEVHNEAVADSLFADIIAYLRQYC